MRPIVSYDDITLPYESEEPASSVPPPAKKRKNNHQKAQAVNADESRELSHNEIWDDSALIDAWDSAKAEYAQYHNGDPDAWKNEPVKKSPLWYNIPPNPSTLEQHAESRPYAATDSKPLDFDTFVPSHDASLDLPVPPAPSGVPGPNLASQFLPGLQGPMVSADEAFSRALGAMYWGGYWTAMYHSQRERERSGEFVEDTEEIEEVEEEILEDNAEGAAESDGELLSTQR